MGNCPKCGAARPQDAVECPQCGIIYARYEGKLAEAKRAQEQVRKEKMTSCPACGAKISKNAASCPHCGEPMQTTAQPALPNQVVDQEKSLKQKRGGLIGCALLLIMLPVFVYSCQETAKYEGTGGGSAQYPGQFQVRPDTIGCKKLEVYNKLANLAKDQSAFDQILYAAIATGECTNLPAGKTAYLEETRLRDGAARIRIQGETSGYWVTLERAK